MWWNPPKLRTILCRTGIHETFAMEIHSCEVLLGFVWSGCAETLVISATMQAMSIHEQLMEYQCDTSLNDLYSILDFPIFRVLSICLPLEVLWNAKEWLRSFALRDLDNWRDKLLQESGDLQQRWPEAMNEIDEETFYVRSCCTFQTLRECAVAFISYETHVPSWSWSAIIITRP